MGYFLAGSVVYAVVLYFLFKSDLHKQEMFDKLKKRHNNYVEYTADSIYQLELTNGELNKEVTNLEVEVASLTRQKNLDVEELLSNVSEIESLKFQLEFSVARQLELIDSIDSYGLYIKRQEKIIEELTNNLSESIIISTNKQNSVYFHKESGVILTQADLTKIGEL